MYFSSFLALLLSLFISPILGAVTWRATPFNPPSVPLAVRSPYLSAWLAQGAGTALNADWPTFWTGSVSTPLKVEGMYPSDRYAQIVGWAGYAKVDGVAYNWMGNPAVPNVTVTKATQKSLQVGPIPRREATHAHTAMPVHVHPKCVCHDGWARGYHHYFP